MVSDSKIQDGFEKFRRAALSVHRLILRDLYKREIAPHGETARSALVSTYRLLFFLAAGCRGLMDIPDFRKSPRPFMQNIHRWARENPPHARRYYSYSDLFEPSRQPLLWRLHPSDEVLKEAISTLMETDPSSWPPMWPGSVYPYLIDAEQRREAGTFYTPDALARHMVAEAIGPFCYRSPAKRRGPRSPEEILSIKALDPAMGDGRFLIAAVDYMAEALAASRNERTRTHHREEVARYCVYGVDRDPMAVDIARICLWLHIGGPEADTGFLRQRLQSGDALMGATLEDMDQSLEFDEDVSQLGLFKREVPPEHVPLAKVAESGRIIGRIKTLAHLWTSIGMDNEEARDLFGFARASVAHASEERWAEIEAHPAMSQAQQLAREYGFLHWELRFPEVFSPRESRPGGFHVIMGNPPYRRERGRGERAASMLSPVAQKWGEGKMDVMTLFIHRGLNLLTPGGLLCFITSSYWLDAEGAQKLRRRVANEEHMVSFVDLGRAPIFSGLTGRHCIVTLAKGVRHPSPTIIMTIKPEREGDSKVVENLLENYKEMFDTVEVSDQRHLLDEEGAFRLGDRDVEALCRKMESSATPLGELVRSSQGVVDNPPGLSKKIINTIEETLPELIEEMGYEVGEPVFLLPTDHPVLNDLTEQERSLARPFYRPVSIRPFALPPAPDAFLLYLTTSTCPDIDRYPNLKRHLERYRPIMEQRREVKEGRIRWWHLHWPRDPEIFEMEHLLVPQMVEAPTAARVAGVAYVGMSAHVLAEPRAVSLRFIEAIINSRAVGFLLDRGRRAKRRGLRIDLTLATLRKIPAPVMSIEGDESTKTEVEKLMGIAKKAFSSSSGIK